MIRRIIILLRHDLAVAFKNKTIYLIACIPLFVYAALTMVDPPGAGGVGIKIALIQTEPYSPGVLESIHRAPGQLAVRWVLNEAEAVRLLKQREVSGILAHESNDASRLQLTVVQLSSVETMTVLQRFSALQIAAEGKGPAWIAEVRPLQSSSVKRQSLPTWILMMVLLVGFIVLPAQVAEEKEKQLLLGWLQTPVRESEWLASKLAYGIVLTLSAAAALQWMSGGMSMEHGVSYFAMLCAGGFCFVALGICLGLLCSNQASARTLGILCYLPLLLPAALSDQSRALRNIARFLPSYNFYEPIRVMLVEDGGADLFARAWITLAAIGVVACLVSHRLIRKRWLM